MIVNVLKLNSRIKQFNNEAIYGIQSDKLNAIKSIIPFLYYNLVNFKKYFKNIDSWQVN